MKTKNLNLVLLLGSVLLITGCGSSASSLTNPPEKACYETGCAAIVGAQKIVDPKKEYVYPDNSQFPDKGKREQYRAPYAFLDLSQVSGNLALSKNFRLSDFAIPQKGRYGLVLPQLVKMVQNMHNKLGTGLRITSGYRSPGYNSGTPDSASWSRHTYGDAVDIQHAKRSLKQLRTACVENKASFFLLYPKHIHCDWRSVPLDPAFYPPSVSQPNPEQALENNQLAMTKGSKIIFSPVNNGIQIATVLPLTDLEGVPVHEWVIHSPSGKVYEFIDSQIQFIPQEFGTYHVEVKVGDFFTLQARFNW
ncbi:MAG: D-Ala-D-Ala carboxypeptidase family metallohydrolase [Bdellovibrionota bacterium]